MTSKKEERKIVMHIGSTLNVTENVIKLVALILGDIVHAIAKELMCWNDQTLISLMRRDSLSDYKGKVGRKKLSQALMILIKHNLLTLSRNTDDDQIRYTFHAEHALNMIRFPRFIVLAKTLFGDEGEILIEKLFLEMK